MTATRAARGRTALTYAERDARAVAGPPLPRLFARLAGHDVAHGFRELTTGLGASQCSACLGWFDDPRHVYPRGIAPDPPTLARPVGPAGPRPADPDPTRPGGRPGSHPSGPAGPRPSSPETPRPATRPTR